MQEVNDSKTACASCCAEGAVRPRAGLGSGRDSRTIARRPFFDKEDLDESGVRLLLRGQSEQIPDRRDARRTARSSALLKPCDTYSLNQLCNRAPRQSREGLRAGRGLPGQARSEQNPQPWASPAFSAVEEQGSDLLVHTMYGDRTVARADALQTKCLSCKGKEHRGLRRDHRRRGVPNGPVGPLRHGAASWRP